MKHKRVRRISRASLIAPSILLVLFLIAAGMIGSRFYTIWREKNALNASPTVVNYDNSTLPAVTDNTKDSAAKPLPSDVFIPVPYTRQAPFSVWDALHEDACEEASLIMVNHYLNGTKIDSADSVDKEIKDLVAYETQNGYGLSISSNDLLTIAEKYYGLKGSVKTSFTLDDLKRDLANGHPVIMPFAGKVLPNPYFRNGGPIYHMLVVIGYDNANFITNDPGTMHGPSMKYTYQAIMDSNHDWLQPDILQGQKAYLVLTKN